MIIVRSNASNGILAIALEGRGAPIGPEATLDVTALAFGNQLQFIPSAPLTATLTNTGLAPLAITRIEANTSFLQTNACPLTLATGASCPISVQMFGSYVGPVTGKLRITSNAPDATTDLSGTTCRIYSVLRSHRGLLTCKP
jgi:hypothetical protein